MAEHDLSYYGKCMIGGILACGLTHTFVVPLDIVKCRAQVDPVEYPSIGAGFRKVLATSGASGLTLGWLPTLIGYSGQGFGKFGFYEIFKDVYAGIAGSKAYEYRTVGYALSSACAEVIADLILCPFEAVKVRIQTSKQGAFPTEFGAAFNKIKTEEGTQGLYKGLYPLWGRQVPYTIVKFVAFERTVEAFYKYIFTAPKETYSKAQKLSVTFMSGYIAGILCAIISQPADTMVSKLNNMKTEGGAVEGMKLIYSQIGFAGLWKGLGARIIMVGTLTGLQWWIYDSFKSAVGLQIGQAVGAQKK